MASPITSASTDKPTVLRFIRHFKGSEEVFLHGCCYWFAHTLQERFGGTMMYAPVENHFVQQIEGRLYDVTGDVTDKYPAGTIMAWDDMESYDPLLYRILLRDCVRKEDFENGQAAPER